ncbi:GGDEF domain-containing protein [Duganella sp. FT3S]|uniref:GGDEF domain-containing protein n=1 Tax=Rugamonas fusca TaxID=2758568 RepID=A0A7W2EL78_9BURK|nr:sensor domain-containing diguanylate cyclase [Rugamonas fusca]MBA5607965.1 GGDEF domain-containing protein [Rugamonas fusca]
MSEPHTASAPDKPLFQYYAAMTWLLAFLACLYVGSSSFRVYQHKRQLEQQIAQQLQNVALSARRSLGLQLSQLVTTENMIADALADHLPPDLASASGRQVATLQALLTREAAGNDDIELLGVADRDGRVLFMSNNVTTVHEGDRIDVSALRGARAPATAIDIYQGGPRSAWPSGFVVTRPVRGADGLPRAFVFALQSHDAFQRRLKEMEQAGFSLGRHSVVAMIQVAGNRLAFRYPMADAIIGAPVPPIARQPFGDQPQLAYWISPYDHIKHLVYELPFANGAYLLRVEAAELDFLAPWYAELVLSGVSTLLLLTALALLLRLVRQGARQAAQLQFDKEQLDIGARAMGRLIATAPVALAHVRLDDGLLLRANPAFGHLFGAMPGEQLKVAESLFADAAVWRELCAGARLAGAAEGRSMEVTLNASEGTRHALVSVAPLPSKRDEPRELLLSFTDTEAQHAREQALATIAYTDPLTRLANRRAFFQQADATFATASRYQRPLALLMIDLDHFKHVNDTYGHAAGDAVLVRTANCLRHSVRHADLPARLGGEEFVVLLPETTLAEALETAERIRKTIALSPPAEFEGQAIPVTASLGVAMMRGDSKGIEAILNEADLALYEAKETGRNKVATAGMAQQTAAENTTAR